MYDELLKNRQTIRKALKNTPADDELLDDLKHAEVQIQREHARIDADFRVRYSPKFEQILV